VFEVNLVRELKPVFYLGANRAGPPSNCLINMWHIETLPTKMRESHNEWRIFAVLFLLWINMLTIPASAQTNTNRPAIAPRPLNISIKELPKSVVAMVKKTFPKGKIVRTGRSAPRAMDEGVEYLFVTVMDGKQECRMVYYGSMTVEISKVLAPANVPAPVTNAVATRYPGMMIESAQEVIADVRHPLQSPPKPLHYELHIVTAKKEKLFIWVEPEVVTNAKGEDEPNGKMYIEEFTESDRNMP